MTLDQDFRVEEITMKFLRLYSQDFFFGVQMWNEIELSKEMGGIDLNEAKEIREFYQKMMNDPM